MRTTVIRRRGCAATKANDGAYRMAPPPLLDQCREQRLAVERRYEVLRLG